MRAITHLSFAFVALCSFTACGGAATPAPPADAGSTRATICANLRRLGCGGAMCERELDAIFASVPSTCSAQRDAYFTCAARATATGCLSNDATFAMCAAQSEALARCAGPIDAGSPSDAPVPADRPDPADAGAAADVVAPADVSTPDVPPAPEDSAAATCVDVAGRFEAIGGGRFGTTCPSGTLTLTRSTAGGATCRFDVGFVSSGAETFAVSDAHVIVDADLSLTGVATVTDGTGTRMGQLSGGLIEMGQGGVLSINRGGDECGWQLARMP